MITIHIRSSCLILFTALLGSWSSVNAQVIANGDFESTTANPWMDAVTTTNVPNWTAEGSSYIVFPHAPNWTEPKAGSDGGNYVMTDGNPEGGIPGAFHTTVTGLTVGQSYLLTFYQGLWQRDYGLPTVGGVSANWEVAFGGASQLGATMFADSTTQTVTPWELQTMTIVATDTSQALDFYAVSPGYPPMLVLDQVSITAVPEPSGAGLLIVATVFPIFARRRRKAAK